MYVRISLKDRSVTVSVWKWDGTKNGIYIHVHTHTYTHTNTHSPASECCREILHDGPLALAACDVYDTGIGPDQSVVLG